MYWFYYFGRFIIRIILFLFVRMRIEGKGNLPKKGALMVVSNHLSSADPPILGVCLTRKIIFMAKEELFRIPVLSYFIRGFGAFPVTRGQVDRKAIRKASSVLEDGLALVMFPEATRSKNARLQQAYNGSALVVSRKKVPILPVGITGTERIKGYGWLFRRYTVHVRIGKPFELPKTEGKVTKDDLENYTNIIMGNIASLLPRGYRGYYSEMSEVKDKSVARN